MTYVPTWGGSLKDLHLGDDKINARGEKGGKLVVPHPPFLQRSLLNSIDLVFVTTTKKRPWESVRGMMRWRNEGGEGSGAGSGGACVWELGALEVSLSQLESSVPLVPCSRVHNSSAVSHRSSSQSEAAGANPPAEWSVFSLPAFSDSSWRLHVFCFEFTLQIMSRVVLLPLQGLDMHYIHITKPLIQALTHYYCMSNLNPCLHLQSAPAETLVQSKPTVQVVIWTSKNYLSMSHWHEHSHQYIKVHSYSIMCGTIASTQRSIY